MKNYKILALVFILTSSYTGFSYEIIWNDPAAKVSYIHQREYYETMIGLIKKAKQSIVMSMYFIDYTLRGEESLPVNMVNELVKAKNRGVTVKVILENTVTLNKRAYNKLIENGIEVHWDHNSQITHSKLVVIDDKFVVIGSTNWTDRALRMNNEASVLIDSPSLAKTVLAELNAQKVMDVTDSEKKDDKEYIFLPKEFLLNPSLAPKMVSASAERAFNLYLALLRMGFEGEAFVPKFQVNYDILAVFFVNDKKDKKAYIQGVNKELDKLEKQYGLIKLNKKYGEMTVLELLDPADKTKLLEIKKQESIGIDKNYWAYGYSKNLSLTAKFIYLVGLYESKMSPTKPWWSMSQEEIVNKYGVKRWTVYNGSKELKEKNILEIDYAPTSKYDKGDFAVRPPNKYKVNELRSEAEKLETLEALAEEYGEDNLNEARQMAKDLSEPNDPLVIEALLDLIKIYDLEKVKAAVAIPAGYKEDNSMRHIRYVIGILQKEK